MDRLLECVKAFNGLLNIEYHIIIARKGKTARLHLCFSKWDFHHLMGLGKLKDLRVAKANRRTVFDEVMRGNITYESISKSRYAGLIENRFAPLMHIEKILDDNRIVFRYNTKLERFSQIEADYLLSTPYCENDIYIFLAEDNGSGNYYCRSFFPKEQKDYTDGQAVWTMLYKEKIHLSTGEKEVQYDRLTPKKSPKKEENKGK